MKSIQIPYQTLTGLAGLAGLTWLAGLTGLAGLAELTEFIQLTGTLLASQISGGCRRSKSGTQKKVSHRCDEMHFFFGCGFCCCPLAAEPSKTLVFLTIRLACQKKCTPLCGEITKKNENEFLPVPPTQRA